MGDEFLSYAENFGHTMDQFSMKYVKVFIVFARRETLEKSSVIKESFMEYRSGEQYSMKNIISLTKNLVTVLFYILNQIQPRSRYKQFSPKFNSFRVKFLNFPGEKGCFGCSLR